MKKNFLFLFLLIFLACPIFALAEQIDINSATLSQLDEIAHVGTKTAQKIIDGRPYSSVQELSRVKGIGDGKYLQDIINQGWACVNCATATPAPTPSSPPISPIPLISPISPISPSPKNIFINEILPAPAGADEQNEWLEIYNGNDFAVDLAGWQIKDQVGAIKTYIWPENSSVGAKGFSVVNRTQSKIVLQNNGDGLTLVNPQGVIVDQIAYPASPANQSYNRANNSWVWSRILTPGQPNEIDKVSAAVQQKIAQKNQTAALSTTTTQTSLRTTALSAQINQFTPSINWLSRIFTFLLGLAIAAASAAVVVFLRKKQKNRVPPYL